MTAPSRREGWLAASIGFSEDLSAFLLLTLTLSERDNDLAKNKHEDGSPAVQVWFGTKKPHRSDVLKGPVLNLEHCSRAGDEISAGLSQGRPGAPSESLTTCGDVPRLPQARAEPQRGRGKLRGSRLRATTPAGLSSLRSLSGWMEPAATRTTVSPPTIHSLTF